MFRILGAVFCLVVLSGMSAASATTASTEAQRMANHLIFDQITDQEIAQFVNGDAEFILAVFDAAMTHFSIPENDRRDALAKGRQRLLMRGIRPPVLGSCMQNVEIENGTNGRVYAYQYVTDYYCDGSDPDKDYRYCFNPQWAYNADNIRWYSNSGLVRSAFSLAYGNLLLGSSLCTSPIQLCLGQWGCFWAGGTNNVKQELWIWSK